MKTVHNLETHRIAEPVAQNFYRTRILFNWTMIEQAQRQCLILSDIGKYILFLKRINRCWSDSKFLRFMCIQDFTQWIIFTQLEKTKDCQTCLVISVLGGPKPKPLASRVWSSSQGLDGNNIIIIITTKTYIAPKSA